ncbi:hypothetical protein EWF20_08835 [Sulfolobus sp. S-194]|uniref:hypothetical protein n=1 Tax=Sulfolobus sp. S-194 TaxID=2512240 RepID=UPI00143715FA|nr:hypothetical protein [Sulfolobus sp. S-194]QIW24236.1 hypothetical protein EWF20_08835 [Sulfolobus sp. S-194]
MLNELLDIIHDLNEDRIIEAANKTLQLIKDKDEEDIIKIAAEIEKEIRAIREDDEIYYIVKPETLEELKRINQELKDARMRKIKILIKDILKRLSNNNVIIIEALKPKTEIRPHTYI